MELAVFQKRLETYWTKDRQQKFLAGRQFLLTPWQGGALMWTLGLLNNDASMSVDASRKFIQINHMLQLLLPSLKYLAKNMPKFRLIDAGCGNAYLSFLLAWYCRDILQHPVEILGIDHQAAMIQRAKTRSELLGFGSVLRFVQSDLQDFDWLTCHREAFPQTEAEARPHGFFALHACDTATDYALAEALRLKADCIAVAPCCQAELAQIWHEQAAKSDIAMGPVLRSPHFRRVVAADMTDMLRTLLIRSRGYEVTATEFVASEHTPKNRLILAQRRGNYLDSAKDEYNHLKTSLGEPHLKLEVLLRSPSQTQVKPNESICELAP